MGDTTFVKANLNRDNINLPADVSQEILQKTQEASAVMQLARQVALPGRGVSIPVITADPSAAWVEETAAKPVSNSSLETKLLRPYKLAVIETFSMEFARDAATLYDTLVRRLPGALSAKFDATALGAVAAPGADFDTFAAVTAQDISPNPYAGLVAADGDISAHGGIVNGYIFAPQGRSILLGATDSTGRPIFVNSAAEGAVPMVLGAPTLLSKGAYKAGTPNTVGVVGDWTQAVYGTVEGVQIAVSDQATVGSINLWERNMVAVRAEIEIGFRADTTVFNRLTD